MQFLVDFIPLLLFLGAYFYAGDIYVALPVLMAAMPVAFAIKWWLTKEIDKMLLGSTILLLVLGAATMLLRNPLFLYWKPTVFYWLAGAVFLGSQFIGQKTITERMFSAVGEMEARRWVQLNFAWAIFFVAAGFLNLYVAYNFSEAFWVKFKVLGFTAITFVFIVLQTLWLFKHMKMTEADNPEVK